MSLPLTPVLTVQTSGTLRPRREEDHALCAKNRDQKRSPRRDRRAVDGCAGRLQWLRGPGGGNGGETAQSLAEKTQYNPQPYENIRDGGTLTTSLPEISPQFNTFHLDGTPYTLAVWRWYNPILITFTPDGQAVYNPDYLTDVKPETVDGNTRITYTINPKATYNDGSPIDWRSFESTWKTSNGTDPAYLVASTDGYDRITSVVRGVDDRQVVVTFRGINLWWQSLFNVLVNPKAADPAVYNQGYVTTPHNEWGAGPYQVQKYDQQNGVIVFERNPKWWGRPGKLDTRTFVTMEDVASLNAFRNGQIDAVDVGSKDRYAQVQGQPGIEIRKGPSLQLDYFTLNGESPVLSDPRVRKAIFEAIDREQILKFHFDGLDYSAEPDGSMIFLPFQDGYADNVGEVVRFDPEQAKKDLDAAGWTVGPDGVRVKDGQPLRFTYVNTGDDPVGKAVAGGTAAMLKNVGAQLDIRQVPSADFSKILTGKQFDMFYSGGVAVRPVRDRVHLPDLLLHQRLHQVGRERSEERRADQVGEHPAHPGRAVREGRRCGDRRAEHATASCPR